MEKNNNDSPKVLGYITLDQFIQYPVKPEALGLTIIYTDWMEGQRKANNSQFSIFND